MLKIVSFAVTLISLTVIPFHEAVKYQITDDYLLEWNITESTVEFVVTAKTSGYVGLGLSLGDWRNSEVILGRVWDDGVTATAPTTTEPETTGSTEATTGSTEVTTEGPVVTTGSTEVTTEEPEVTTEEPEVTTEEPEVTTEEPEVTTEEPEVTTEDPEVTTEDPEVTTEDPEVTTEDPEVTTEEIPEPEQTVPPPPIGEIINAYEIKDKQLGQEAHYYFPYSDIMRRGYPKQVYRAYSQYYEVT